MVPKAIRDQAAVTKFIPPEVEGRLLGQWDRDHAGLKYRDLTPAQRRARLARKRFLPQVTAIALALRGLPWR